MPLSRENLDFEPNPIDAIFIPQITDMHGIPFDNGGERGCGRGWTIDPAYGQGTYWYLSIDNMMAIAVYDLLFHEEISFGSYVPDFLCFGSYGRNMVPYFAPFVGLDEGWETGTLLGYSWRRGMCRETAHADEPLIVTSIALMPQATVAMAKRIGCSLQTLTSAIAALDGTQRILPLLHVFDEIRQSRPSPTVARAYYECKVMEACTLLVDWWEKLEDADAPRVHAADRTAFNCACAYAREHLADRVVLEDLCRASCVSASKLTALFRTIEGTTPLGYVRELRMERACELLETSGEALSAIATEVGFERQGSFSEAFKARFGMTPREYRAASAVDSGKAG